MKRKKFKIPIYFGHLEIYISDDWKATSDKHNLGVKECYYTGYDGLTHSTEYKNGTNRYWILLKPDAKRSTFAHESVHIASYLFRNAGVLADYENDEPFAYMVEWVCDKIELTFNSKNNGKNN
jgi:hypothetical protein